MGLMTGGDYFSLLFGKNVFNKNFRKLRGRLSVAFFPKKGRQNFKAT